MNKVNVFDMNNYYEGERVAATSTQGKSQTGSDYLVKFPNESQNGRKDMNR